MTTEVSLDLRCYWCNCLGAGDTGYGGCVENGIIFCWQSTTVPFHLCSDILKKMDTMVDNYECPVCMETKKALEMPRCSHKVCLDCYKTIYFGVSELEQPCSCRDLNYPKWTYELQFDEDGDVMDNEKEEEHTKFLYGTMDYKLYEDKRPYEELIELRDNLMCYRPEWMNIQEIINYENDLFKICSEYRIKLYNYLASRTIGNKSCPLCRICYEANISQSYN